MQTQQQVLQDKMKEDKKIFVDRFDNKSYSISIYENKHYTTDVAIVHDYHQENPSLSFNATLNLDDINEIITVVTRQQEDVETFGVLLTELNSEK